MFEFSSLESQNARGLLEFSQNFRIQQAVADSNDIRYPRALIARPIRGLPTRSFNSRSRRGMQPTTSTLLHGVKGKRCVVMELEGERNVGR